MTSHNGSYDHIWFPFSYYEDLCQHGPITIERGEGMYLFDTNGKRYMDGVGSWWVSILGHCHPEVSEAIHRQLKKLDHVIMAGFISPVTGEVSERLAALLPKGLDKIFYSDDGSTAVEAAMKMAIQYWALKGEKRNRFIAFGGAYHGDTLGAMSVGCISQYHTLFHQRFSKQFFTDPPYCYRCPVAQKPQSCSAQCMDSMEDILRRHGEQIAACIIEPMVQGAGGMRVYPAKVIKRVSQLCERYGILLIDDEVAMGFGRTGKLFACEHADVVP
ncbi:MAG: aspartate aminotransferase family protein, partial [Chitinivibrionales bacterium]